ncbi:MAG TPA: inositol monophosphatase family protein [Aestuariivirga sp.]|nr:inositol monophosphatase family protein [Aestuariivirga sp.]
MLYLTPSKRHWSGFPMTPDWTRLADFALHLAGVSADAILPWFRSPLVVEDKSGSGKAFDPVTEGDRAGERALRAAIAAQFPDHGIIGEEYGETPGTSPFTWVLDPVDGTRSFMIGMPNWATLIALYHHGQPVIGVMNQPHVGECFLGTPEGAWLHRHGEAKALKTRRGVPLRAAAIGTTAPELYHSPDDAAGFAALRQSCRLMRYGGDAYFFCLMAAGHLDIAMDAGLQAFDIGALIPIITGAGGVVGSWSGDDPAQGGNIISAGSPALLDEAIAVMQAKKPA